MAIFQASRPIDRHRHAISAAKWCNTLIARRKFCGLCVSGPEFAKDSACQLWAGDGTVPHAVDTFGRRPCRSAPGVGRADRGNSRSRRPDADRDLRAAQAQGSDPIWSGQARSQLARSRGRYRGVPLGRGAVFGDRRPRRPHGRRCPGEAAPSRRRGRAQGPRDHRGHRAPHWLLLAAGGRRCRGDRDPTGAHVADASR